MAKLDFSDLIAPFTAREFFAQYWQQAALLVKRDDPARYCRLLDADDAAAVLRLAGQLPRDAVEVIGTVRHKENASGKTGEGPTEAMRETESEAGAEAGELLADLFSKGATIRVKAIERFRQPLGELCRSLEAELGFPLRANLYCTPGNSRGFNLHFDTHEVFVLQLLGEKRWQVYPPTETLPLEFVPPLPFEDSRDALRRAHGGRKQDRDVAEETELGPLALEATLRPGDCLYLPRGFVHQAAAQDEPSIHLTIGVHVLTWLDLLSVALGQAADRHEELRRALPVGLFKLPGETEASSAQASKFESEFNALAQLFAGEANFADAVRAMTESLADRRRAGQTGDNHDATGDLANVDTETSLAGNGPLRFYLAADGTMAGLAGNEKELWLPVAFAPALRFVTEQSSFQPGQIPGLVSDNGKLAFVRNLLKDGFVRVADE